MSRTTWRQLITEALQEDGSSWDDVVAHTFQADQLDRGFDSGYGGEEGCPFTLWTSRRVYFPCCYDGAEWVSSAPRDPCEEAMRHVGG